MPTPEFMLQLRKHVGHDLLFVPGVAVLIFNEKNEILLNRRTDNGRWAIIGGTMEPGGESPADAAVREAFEETGVRIEIERVSGVYTTPVITFPNGDTAQYASFGFRCRPLEGVPYAADDESSEARYFPLDALPDDLTDDHRRRIRDAAEPGAGLPARFDALLTPPLRGRPGVGAAIVKTRCSRKTAAPRG